MERIIDFHTHHINEGHISVRSYSIGKDDLSMLKQPYTTGIHPWDVEGVDVGAGLELLEALSPIGIGEIGLDYSRNIDHQKQQNIFELQVEMAIHKSLPIIIHCVKAFDDIMAILNGLQISRVAFHSYIGSVQQTAEALNSGYVLSFGPRSLKSLKTVESLRETPLDRLFIETDDSDVQISSLYEEIAEIKGVSRKCLTKHINENYKNFFNL